MNDLALLRITNSIPQVKPLILSTQPWNETETIYALGYPLARPTVCSTRLSGRIVGGKVLGDVIPNDLELRRLFRNMGFLSLNAAVLDLQGNLTHGHSGAPIVREDGTVIGVADGGLVDGTVGSCWAIRVSAVLQLTNSLDVQRSTIAATRFESSKIESLFHQLFAAETTSSDVNHQAKIGDLIKLCAIPSQGSLGRESYDNVKKNSDDANNGDPADPKTTPALPSEHNIINVQYDIWEDDSLGVDLTIPHGAHCKQLSTNLYAFYNSSAGPFRLTRVYRISPGEAVSPESVAQSMLAELKKVKPEETFRDEDLFDLFEEREPVSQHILKREREDGVSEYIEVFHFYSPDPSSMALHGGVSFYMLYTDDRIVANIVGAFLPRSYEVQKAFENEVWTSGPGFTGFANPSNLVGP